MARFRRLPGRRRDGQYPRPGAGARLETMLPLQSHGQAQGWLQPYDVSLWRRVLHDMRYQVEGLRLPMVQRQRPPKRRSGSDRSRCAADPGGLRDIFDGNGPPAPRELQNLDLMTRTLAPRPRAPSHQEETRLRSLQGQRDAEMAQQLRYSERLYDGHDIIGDVEQVHGIGNAAGHLMNDDYRSSGHYRLAVTTPRVTSLERHGDCAARDRSKRGDSIEQRLADRMSETRHRARAPATVPRTRRVTVEQVGEADEEPHGEHEPHSNRRRRMGRWERCPSGRDARTLADEIPKSDMAGLTGSGQGMSYVSQWRSFVVPGAPDEASSSA